MKIATWNINSVRLRIQLVTNWLKENQPDVLCLQETKTEDQFFPVEAFAEAEWPHVVMRGEKSYNGVAIISRLPITDSGYHLWTGRADCRHISATIEGQTIHNFYVPAGGDEPDPKINDKFKHKLDFLDEATTYMKTKEKNAYTALVGDLNIAPHENDVWSHKQLLKIVSHTPVEVEKLNKFQDSINFVDSLREFHPFSEKLYSWWSYRSKNWEESDRGRRLDHIWITQKLNKIITRASIEKDVRRWNRPSDHSPLIADFKF